MLFGFLFDFGPQDKPANKSLQKTAHDIIAARPSCGVFDPWERWERVKLGSESLSGVVAVVVGRPEIWKSGKSNTFPKIEILIIKIHSVKNVGKVWIGRENKTPHPFSCHFNNFPMDKTSKKKLHVCLQFSLVDQWLLFDRFGIQHTAKFPYVSTWEHLSLSALGGLICRCGQQWAQGCLQGYLCGCGRKGF